MSRRWNPLVAVTLFACMAVVGQGCKKESTGGGGAVADLSTPKAAAVAMATAMANGDKAAVRACTTGPEDAVKTIEAMSEMGPAMAAFRKAADDKFGKDNKLSKRFADPASGEAVAKFEAADYKVEGDVATVIEKGRADDKMPMKLKREGDKWKVDLTSMGVLPGAQGPKRVAAMVAAMRDTTGEITAGKHVTVDAAEAAMSARMGKAMTAE